jgi:hypothetical protein
METTSLSIEWNEVAGKAIQNLWKTIIQYGIGNPHTNVKDIITIEGYIDAVRNGIESSSVTPDLYSFTALAYEPDPTHTKALEAFMLFNQYPQSSGEIQLSRNLVSNKDIGRLSITFNGFAVTDSSVLALANAYITRHRTTGMGKFNSDTVSSIDGIAGITKLTNEIGEAIKPFGNSAGVGDSGSSPGGVLKSDINQPTPEEEATLKKATGKDGTLPST